MSESAIRQLQVSTQRGVLQTIASHTCCRGLGLQHHADNSPPYVMLVSTASQLVQFHSLLLLASKIKGSAVQKGLVIVDMVDTCKADTELLSAKPQRNIHA